MGWRFRKSIKILPGIKINIGKDGVTGVSIGPRGAHINIGKRGTTLSTGIPGTGIHYTTRLDKPVGKKMSVCPYCGHRMRKQWDACPKCRIPLVQEEAAPEPIEPESDSAPAETTPPPAPEKPQVTEKQPKGCLLGCGTVILLVLLLIIGSCFGSHGKQKETAQQPAAVTETTNQPEAENPHVVTKEEPKAPVEEAAPPPAPAVTAASPPAQSAPTEKMYYGNGPNGEGIKGHVGKNGRIYHIPGSTYYNRTKHVSQWFFTEKEAQEAGYRPPEK
nr:MAG TPA: Protein of unknown function (DUF4236) [Caudoviricetes sp.]